MISKEDDLPKPAASAPPAKLRFSIAKPQRQRTVNTEHKSTQGNTSAEGLTTSFFGKRSVEDVWEDLFQIEGTDELFRPKVRPFTQERSIRNFNDGQAQSDLNISARGIEGSSLPQRARLLDPSLLGKMGRRVASINIPGIISRFSQSQPRNAEVPGPKLDDSKEPKQKDRLEKEDYSHPDIVGPGLRSKEMKDGQAENKESSSSLENRVNRRYCIVDNFLYNSTRPLPEKLEFLLDLFKKTIFSSETDFVERIKLETIKTKIFGNIAFLGSKGYDKKAYLNNFQLVIETLISHFRSMDLSKSFGKKSSMLNFHVLKGDLVYLAIRKLVNFESMLIIFDLYFKILLALGSLEKAESLGKVCLSLAYIAGLSNFKIEAYNMLGQVFERRKQPETALLCFTRAMQFCIEAKQKVRECYMCDKIGLQLYYLNEMDLAKLYHVRFLMAFHEPDLSNAILRSQEILLIEEQNFTEYYLLRQSNPIDKYRAADMVLNLKMRPFDEFLKIERDDRGNPTILNFIELMLSVQKRGMESMKLKKVSIIEDSIFGKKNREFERGLRDNESSKKVTFTPAGMHMLIECNEYIPKISASLVGMQLKTGLRITHQKDINVIFNYINQSIDHPQDFETVKTKANELARKTTVEDILMFLTRARYFVMRKINEVGNIKASKYHRMLRPSMKNVLDSKSSLLQ